MKLSQFSTNKYFSQQNIDEYLSILNNDGVFAYPTDTVWGIGCLAQSEVGCKRIYNIKKRDGKKPLILLGADFEDFKPYLKNISPVVEKLAQKYFPGALTIISPKSSLVGDFMTSGLDSVGFRVPAHPVLREFLSYSGVIASTSANLSGEPAAVDLQQTRDYLENKVDFILDDFGIAAQGLASTVVLTENETVKILRKGDINPEI